MTKNKPNSIFLLSCSISFSLHLSSQVNFEKRLDKVGSTLHRVTYSTYSLCSKFVWDNVEQITNADQNFDIMSS